MKYSKDYNGLKKFIKDTIGYNINENTVFFRDLYLVGHDADEFVTLLSREFEVDMTGFEFNKYLVDEYSVPFLYWYDKFFRKEKISRKEFDLNHLLKVIQEKKWIDV